MVQEFIHQVKKGQDKMNQFNYIGTYKAIFLVHVLPTPEDYKQKGLKTEEGFHNGSWTDCGGHGVDYYICKP